MVNNQGECLYTYETCPQRLEYLRLLSDLRDEEDQATRYELAQRLWIIRGHILDHNAFEVFRNGFKT